MFNSNWLRIRPNKGEKIVRRPYTFYYSKGKTGRKRIEAFPISFQIEVHKGGIGEIHKDTCERGNSRANERT